MHTELMCAERKQYKRPWDGALLCTSAQEENYTAILRPIQYKMQVIEVISETFFSPKLVA